MLNSSFAVTAQFVFFRPRRLRLALFHLNQFSYQSLPIVLFCLSFAAIVVIIESSFHMKLIIQNDALVPGFACVLIVRELGPVISALLLTSRMGASIAAEVGIMKVTEQIEALRLMGIDLNSYLVIPRALAGLIGGAMVSILSCLTALVVAALTTEIKLKYGVGDFLSALRTFVSLQDLFHAAIKGAVFGLMIPLAACFHGLRCGSGSDEVGKATTKTVVHTSVLIIISDFILSWLFTVL